MSNHDGLSSIADLRNGLERRVQERTVEPAELNEALQAEIAERKWAETLLAGQNRVLEMIAKGAPLADVLNVLARFVEEQSQQILCSILLLDRDGLHLRHGAAPSLPESYNRAIDGVAIGQGVGSWNTAAFLEQPMIVSDIATDPLWQDYRELALRHGLRACWSTPIFSATNQVLGTFVMYYHEVRRPTRGELHLIEIAMHLAGIAIARQQAEEEKSELLAHLDGQIEELTAFRRLLESAPDAHVIVNSEGRIVLVNAQTEAMFGYRQNELLGQPVEILFPARFEQVHFAHRQHYLGNTHLRPMNIGLDLAGRRQDGSEFPVEVSLSSLKTKDDVLITSVIRDITERKRADKELRQRLQALSRRLLEVQEIERRHIAHELHDEIGQILTALTLILDMNSRSSARAIRTSLNEAQTLVNELMERVDELALNLRPAMLDDLGLLPALLWHFERYTRQTRVQVTFKHRRLEGRRFAPGVETAAYRIVQEALTNVARYAGVSQVTVRLWADADTLDVQIEDQGVGFDPQAALTAGDSIGLSGMQKRAVLLGGQLRIESAPGAGVCLTAELPLQGSA